MFSIGILVLLVTKWSVNIYMFYPLNSLQEVLPLMSFSNENTG